MGLSEATGSGSKPLARGTVIKQCANLVRQSCRIKEIRQKSRLTMPDRFTQGLGVAGDDIRRSVCSEHEAVSTVAAGVVAALVGTASSQRPLAGLLGA